MLYPSSVISAEEGAETTAQAPAQQEQTEPAVQTPAPEQTAPAPAQTVEQPAVQNQTASVAENAAPAENTAAPSTEAQEQAKPGSGAATSDTPEAAQPAQGTADDKAGEGASTAGQTDNTPAQGADAGTDSTENKDGETDQTEAAAPAADENKDAPAESGQGASDQTTGQETEKETEKVTEKEPDGETDQETEKETEKKTEKKTGKEADKEAGKENDKKPEDTKVKAFTGTSRVARVEKGALHAGDTVTLQVIVQNANLAYKVRWEALKDGAWTPFEMKTVVENSTYSFVVTEENAAFSYRAVLTFTEKGVKDAPSAALKLPKLTVEEKEEEKPAEAPEETEAATEAEAVTETEAATEAAQEETELDTLDGSVTVEEVESSNGGKAEDTAEDQTEKEAAEEEAVTEVTDEAEEEEAEPIVVVTTSRSRFRVEADGMSDIIDVIPAGASFTVLGIEGDWVKIEYNGRIGYTYKTNVSGLPEEEPETDENGDPVKKERKVTLFTSKWVATRPGENIYITSQLEGFEDCTEIAYQWLCDKGSGFEPVEGATGSTLQFVADKDTVTYYWKLRVYCR